jgi:hypothetical protein
LPRSVYVLFSILILFRISWSSELPQNIYLIGQSPLHSFLLWQEIQADTIQFPYFLPSKETTINDIGLNDFYQSWHSCDEFPVFFRIDGDLISSTRSNRVRKIFRGISQHKLGPKLFIQNNFEIDSHGFEDNHFRGAKTLAFGDWTTYLQHSAISYIFETGHISAGKGNIFTSAFGNSLIINSNFPPAEFVWWHQNYEKLNFDWGIKLLTTLNGINRFLTFHRYAYSSRILSIGFTEMALVGYDDISAKEYSYLMPSSFFYETEVNNIGGSNLMWGFDFLLKYWDYTINCELLVDDYAIDGLSPAKIGLKIGIGHNGPYFDLYSEYVRINRWTGNYYYPELRYVEDSVLIGSPIGPDAHSMKVMLFKQVKDKLYLTTSISWIESGNGNIYEWPVGVDSGRNFGYRHEEFPTRPITTKYESTFILEYLINPHVNSGLKWNISSIDPPLIQFHIKLNI